jgi:hypothetical protein
VTTGRRKPTRLKVQAPSAAVPVERGDPLGAAVQLEIPPQGGRLAELQLVGSDRLDAIHDRMQGHHRLHMHRLPPVAPPGLDAGRYHRGKIREAGVGGVSARGEECDGSGSIV